MSKVSFTEIPLVLLGEKDQPRRICPLGSSGNHNRSSEKQKLPLNRPYLRLQTR